MKYQKRKRGRLTTPFAHPHARWPCHNDLHHLRRKKACGFEKPLTEQGLEITGGDGGSRTHDTGLSPYASLAGKCLRPLGHVSTPVRDRTATTRLRMIAFHAELVNETLLPNADNQALSRPNALCNARTASSMYFSSIKTEILISEVEII